MASKCPNADDMLVLTGSLENNEHTSIRKQRDRFV
jgi:hypothetical protein